MTARPTYGAAVLWIALNDAPADADAPEGLAGYISVALAADLFGKDSATVAQDVYAARNGCPTVSLYRVLLMALRAQGWDDAAARAYINKGIVN